MNNFHLTVLAIAFLVCGGLDGGESECMTCQTNDAACINATSFHLCFGDDQPHTEQVFHCPESFECTDTPNICFQKSTKPASCGDVSSCGLCNHNQVFACTSRSTFRFCFGDYVPSRVNGTCPPSMICDASSPDICVHERSANSIICDRNDDAPADVTMGEKRTKRRINAKFRK